MYYGGNMRDGRPAAAAPAARTQFGTSATARHLGGMLPPLASSGGSSSRGTSASRSGIPPLKPRSDMAGSRLAQRSHTYGTDPSRRPFSGASASRLSRPTQSYGSSAYSSAPGSSGSSPSSRYQAGGSSSYNIITNEELHTHHSTTSMRSLPHTQTSRFGGSSLGSSPHSPTVRSPSTRSPHSSSFLSSSPASASPSTSSPSTSSPLSAGRSRAHNPPSSPSTRRQPLSGNGRPYDPSHYTNRPSLQDTSMTAASRMPASMPTRTPASTGVSTTHGSGQVGLRNLGNTCFMNSVLQCLSHAGPLRGFFLSNRFRASLNRSSPMKGQLAMAFAELLEELWAVSSSGSTSPVAFKREVGNWAPRFVGYSQQDAQEFLRFLLDGLHEDVKKPTPANLPAPLSDEKLARLPLEQQAKLAFAAYRSRNDSPLVDIFVGQLRSTLTYTCCGHESVTFDPFWDLSLPIPDKKFQLDPNGKCKIYDCLEEFVSEEVLDGDERPTCERCRKPARATKVLAIQRLPDVLVLYIKRFSYTMYSRKKIDDEVVFPVKKALNLTEFCEDGGQHSYSLFAVSNHIGSYGGGHYTASCLSEHDGWHKFNDSIVSSMTAPGVRGPHAYVLFYQRQ